MTVRASSANSQVLRWARETVGLSVEDVAERLGRPIVDILSWEAGTASPTFSQLERLADSIYRRPVAIFFFPSPPDEPEITSEFRTLPGSELAKLERDTRLAIRDLHAYQLSLMELTDGKNTAGGRLITRLVTLSSRTSYSRVAGQVRQVLDVDLRTQSRWASAERAFKQWRTALENAGVFVFKRSLEQREISGLCLSHAEFPVILVNNTTPFTRQVFTLFHELAHLLVGVSSVTTTDMSLTDRLTGQSKDIEVRCNEFAAEFLVPAQSFPWQSVDLSDVDMSVDRLAHKYSVSREVILRRFLDKGIVDEETYRSKAAAWMEEAQQRRSGGKPGGSYYATQVSYLGEAYLELGFSQYRAGNVSLGELADYFGMRAETVGKLESYLLDRR